MNRSAPSRDRLDRLAICGSGREQAGRRATEPGFREQLLEFENLMPEGVRGQVLREQVQAARPVRRVGNRAGAAGLGRTIRTSATFLSSRVPLTGPAGVTLSCIFKSTRYEPLVPPVDDACTS